VTGFGATGWNDFARTRIPRGFSQNRMAELNAKSESDACYVVVKIAYFPRLARVLE